MVNVRSAAADSFTNLAFLATPSAGYTMLDQEAFGSFYLNAHAVDVTFGDLAAEPEGRAPPAVAAQRQRRTGPPSTCPVSWSKPKTPP